jgi:hypothetical protein
MQNGMYDYGIHRAHIDEESRIDADSLVHANPIGADAPANPIGAEAPAKQIGDDPIGAEAPAKQIGDDPIGDDLLGDEGDVHANLIDECDKTAMSEFLDESDFWSSNPTSMPTTKKRKNTLSIQTSVCPLHEIRALVDERLTALCMCAG